MRTLKLIQGWWRHVWGFCPKCNCDAPECDKCDICYDYASKVRGKPDSFPFPKVERDVWWVRFKELLALTLMVCICSCQLATHEAHASATKWEKDTNITWGGTTHTTGADGWDNATDHNASFQVGAQTAGTLFTGLFGYLATKAMYLEQQMQNANLSAQALATTKANLQITLAQLQANAVTGQQKNFAALIASGAINQTNVGTLRH